MILILPFIFQLILALDENAQYGDGTKANTESDVISRAMDKTRQVAGNVANNVPAPKPRRDENALEKIGKLAEMRDQGIITQEEFEAKKAELLTKI